MSKRKSTYDRQIPSDGNQRKQNDEQEYETPTDQGYVMLNLKSSKSDEKVPENRSKDVFHTLSEMERAGTPSDRQSRRDEPSESARQPRRRRDRAPDLHEGRGGSRYRESEKDDVERGDGRERETSKSNNRRRKESSTEAAMKRRREAGRISRQRPSYEEKPDPRKGTDGAHKDDSSYEMVDLSNVDTLPSPPKDGSEEPSTSTAVENTDRKRVRRRERRDKEKRRQESEVARRQERVKARKESEKGNERRQESAPIEEDNEKEKKEEEQERMKKEMDEFWNRVPKKKDKKPQEQTHNRKQRTKSSTQAKNQKPKKSKSGPKTGTKPKNGTRGKSETNLNKGTGLNTSTSFNMTTSPGSATSPRQSTSRVNAQFLENLLTAHEKSGDLEYKPSGTNSTNSSSTGNTASSTSSTSNTLEKPSSSNLSVKKSFMNLSSDTIGSLNGIPQVPPEVVAKSEKYRRLSAISQNFKPKESEKQSLNGTLNDSDKSTGLRSIKDVKDLERALLKGEAARKKKETRELESLPPAQNTLPPRPPANEEGIPLSLKQREYLQDFKDRYTLAKEEARRTKAALWKASVQAVVSEQKALKLKKEFLRIKRQLLEMKNRSRVRTSTPRPSMSDGSDLLSRSVNSTARSSYCFSQYNLDDGQAEGYETADPREVYIRSESSQPSAGIARSGNRRYRSAN
ncbi:unnamed protein product [Bursaphelenchus okinawaensis]|uniref:Uncharacterized protein n=1 Tax=Bursaphelenchus okinawaensis TaxID=465554 RepID=A0A811KIZ2_9BILA|nr:unnamed protein product [Bursaphelenchus okinawaensis]CAG9103576.1 unnamed protein product [Bursaphelenchus okinawaensis]